MKLRSTDCRNRTCQMGPIANSDKITVTDHTFFGSIPLVARARAFWRVWHRNGDDRISDMRKKNSSNTTTRGHVPVESVRDALIRSNIATLCKAEPIPRASLRDTRPEVTGRVNCMCMRVCMCVYNVCKECNAKKREAGRKKERERLSYKRGGGTDRLFTFDDHEWLNRVKREKRPKDRQFSEELMEIDVLFSSM